MTVYHPGEYLMDELLARSMTVHELSIKANLPIETLANLVNQASSIDALTAEGLARALGTSMQLWINLQATYEREQAFRHGS